MPPGARNAYYDNTGHPGVMLMPPAVRNAWLNNKMFELTFDNDVDTFTHHHYLNRDSFIFAVICTLGRCSCVGRRRGRSGQEPKSRDHGKRRAKGKGPKVKGFDAESGQPVGVLPSSR